MHSGRAAVAEHAPLSLPTLVQRFFLDHLTEQRAVSAQTVAAYRDTLRLLFNYAATVLRRTPSAITLSDLDAPLLLAFLDHLEKGQATASEAAMHVSLQSGRSLNMHRITTLRRWPQSSGRWRYRSSGSIGHWSAFSHDPRSSPSSKRLTGPVGPANVTAPSSA